MKRILTLCMLLASMFLIVLPGKHVSAKEDSFYYTEDTRWSYDHETIVIIGADSDFTSFNGERIYREVSELRFEEGITKLDPFVFYYFPNVTKVVLPRSLENIGTAFYPFEYEDEDNNFSFLTKLIEISVHNCNPYYMSKYGILYSKDQTRLICYPNGKTYDKYTMPEFVTKIDNQAFGNNPYLKTIIFGSRYQWPDMESFSYYGDLPNVKEYKVANNNPYLKAIDGVLYNWDLTELISYPRGKKLAKYVVKDTVTKLHDKALEYAYIDELVLPSDIQGLTYDVGPFTNNLIKEFTIYYGTQFTTVDGVLYNKEKSEMVCWPGRKTDTTLKFPSTLTSLQLSEWRFPKGYLSTIKQLIIPKATEYIDFSENMSSLETITVESGSKYFTLESGLLYSKDKSRLFMIPQKGKQTSITIPAAFRYNFMSTDNISMPSVTKIVVNGNGYNFPYEYFTNLSQFERGAGNQKVTIKENVLYSQNGKTLIWYPQMKSDLTYVMPETVTNMEANAFAQQENLISITLSSNLDLSNIDEAKWFAGCSNLKEVKVSAGNRKLTSVNGILYNKDKTVLICLPAAKNCTNFIVPETVTTMYLAQNQYMQQMTLGKNVTDIIFYDYIKYDNYVGFPKLKEFIVDDKNTVFQSQDGVLCRDYYNGFCPIAYPRNKQDEIFTFTGVIENADITFTWAIKNHPYLKYLRSDVDNIIIFGKYCTMNY